jgi:hypothetical protein
MASRPGRRRPGPRGGGEGGTILAPEAITLDLRHDKSSTEVAARLRLGVAILRRSEGD